MRYKLKHYDGYNICEAECVRVEVNISHATPFFSKLYSSHLNLFLCYNPRLSPTTF